MSQIIVDENKCIKCGLCTEVCPARIIMPGTDTAVPFITPEQEDGCIDCGHCAVFCPSAALGHVYDTVQGPTIAYKDPGITAEQIELYIKSRRSVRSYLDKPVAKETIEKVLDLARYAPTAANMQQVKWVIVQDTNQTKNLVKLTIDWMQHLVDTRAPMASMINAKAAVAAWQNGTDTIFRGAPHLAVTYAPNDNPFSDNDAMIALSYFDLALPAFGLGGFWTGYFKFASDEWAPIRQALGIPEDHHVVYGIAYGYQKLPMFGIPERKPADILWR